MKKEKTHEIALRILDPSVARENKKLHPKLKRHLTRAHKLCKNAGGAMISRQAIVILIMQWENQNKATQPLLTK